MTTIPIEYAQIIDETLSDAYDEARRRGHLGTAVRLTTARNLFRTAHGLEEEGEAAAEPCKCPAGAACEYRAEPPGDPDTGHCQDCGAWMPQAPGSEPGDEHECPECGSVYVIGEPEDA